MSENTEKILAEALELPPIERAELIEELLSSFFLQEKRLMNYGQKKLKIELTHMKKGK